MVRISAKREDAKRHRPEIFIWSDRTMDVQAQKNLFSPRGGVFQIAETWVRDLWHAVEPLVPAKFQGGFVQ